MDRRRNTRQRKWAAAPVVSPPSGPPPAPPEPRPVFHSERRPGRIGDYVILAALEQGVGGHADLVGRVRVPGDGDIEVIRRPLAGLKWAPPDARKGFGPPEGLPPELLREVLGACRAWVHQDNARRRTAEKKPTESTN